MYLRQKWIRPHVPISSIAPFYRQLYANKMLTTIGRTVTSYSTESYKEIHAGNIVPYTDLKQCNLGVEWSEGCDYRVPKVEVQLVGTSCKIKTCGSEELSSGIWEIGSNHSENLHDEKMKLLNDLGQYREEGWNQEGNRSHCSQQCR